MSEMQRAYAAPTATDTGSFGWAVLGFFVPIAGLILWLVWKDTRPRDSARARNGFVAGLVVGVLFGIAYAVFMGTMLAALSVQH